MAAATLIVLVVSALIHKTTSDPRADLLGKQCGLGIVNNITAYKESYSKLLKSMEMDMRKNKFSARDEGDPPNRVYALAQCMDDLSKDDCTKCFSEIVTELDTCFPSPSGRVYFDGCFMRFEDYNFYGETVTQSDIMKRCTESTETSEEYKTMVGLVINDTVESATSNNGYADRQGIMNGKPVCAMASCWKTLDRNSCSSCLKVASETILNCLPALEGRVLCAGCFLRYSNYDFSKGRSLDYEASIFLYVAYVFGAVGLCLLAIVIGFFMGNIIYKKLNSLNNYAHGTEMGSMVGKETFLFKYSTLQKATDDFNQANKIGRGGYGEVFKGTLADGREIAIKRLFVSRKYRTQEVGNEMDIICQAQHKNLVRLLGCCFTAEESFLVYEFLANNSLDLILFDSEKKKELDWKRRLGILIGTAEGLEYLHTDCQVKIIHRDIKASNILLDLKYRPKIADFGLARFNCGDLAASNTIAGTLGYMAPEYLAQGLLTEKADVYSYGVLVLEIVSGKQSNTFQSEDSLSNLVTTTWKHFEADTVADIIDKSMEIEGVEKEVVERAVQIGLLCTQEVPSLRPSMSSVVHMLRHEDSPLARPTKPPFTDVCLTLSSSLGSSRAHSLGSFHSQCSSFADSCKYFDTNNPR